MMDGPGGDEIQAVGADHDLSFGARGLFLTIWTGEIAVADLKTFGAFAQKVRNVRMIARYHECRALYYELVDAGHLADELT